MSILSHFPSGGGGPEAKYEITIWNDGRLSVSVRIGSESIAVDAGEMVKLSKQYTLKEFFSATSLKYSVNDRYANCIEFEFSSANELMVHYLLGSGGVS